MKHVIRIILFVGFSYFFISSSYAGGGAGPDAEDYPFFFIRQMSKEHRFPVWVTLQFSPERKWTIWADLADLESHTFQGHYREPLNHLFLSYKPYGRGDPSIIRDVKLDPEPLKIKLNNAIQAYRAQG